MLASPRLWIVAGCAALLLIGGAAWAINGTAILLDLSTASARLFCL